MNDFFDYAGLVFAAIGAVFTWFFGEFNGIMKMLVALCVIDYFTGVIAAYIMHILSSSTGFKGIAKKVTMFILVGIAQIIDREMLGNTALLRNAVIFFYLANEGLSILENAIFIGIPIPKVLKSNLLQLKEQNGNVKTKNDDPEKSI